MKAGHQTAKFNSLPIFLAMYCELVTVQCYVIFQLNRGLEDKQVQTQQEFQSLRDENKSLRTKVEVENENLRLAAEVKLIVASPHCFLLDWGRYATKSQKFSTFKINVF